MTEKRGRGEGGVSLQVKVRCSVVLEEGEEGAGGGGKEKGSKRQEKGKEKGPRWWNGKGKVRMGAKEADKVRQEEEEEGQREEE